MSNSVSTPGSILLPAARVAFVQVFTPRAFEEGMEPVYSLTALLDPNIPEHKAAIKQVRKAAADLMVEAWGSKKVDLKHVCFGFADDDMAERYDGYEGMFWVRVKNKRRPVVIDRDKSALAEDDGRLYSGSFCNVSMDMWCQKKSKYGKNISGNLRGVQFVRDGDAFGGQKVDVDKEFPDMTASTASADDDDLDDDAPF